jgi:hypothetical protein
MAEHCATTRGAGNNRAFEDAANARISGELQGKIERVEF